MAATWKQSVTTNSGIALMNKAYGVSSIIPTKAVTITDNISSYSVTQIQSLTTINYNQSRKPIVISNQSNTTRIGIDIDNKDVNEQYDYYGIGIYFKQVSTGEEVLFSVIALTDAATIIPNQSGVATSSISIDAYSSIVPGTKIDLTVSDSGSVTRSDVEQIVAANQSYSFPKTPAATGTDVSKITSIGIVQIKNDTTVLGAPNGFSGSGYLNTTGDGTTANPIVQELVDTGTGLKYINVYDSTNNKWMGWQEFAYISYVQQQLATKADTSSIDPSVLAKTTLTANDDVLALDAGTYYTWGAKPKNFPALSPWSTVVVKVVANQGVDGKSVTITDTNASQLFNTYSGSASTGKWTGWRVPNSTTMASKTDVATAVSTKQDKLSYVPADDSKVLHNLPTLLPSGTDLDTVTSSGDYQAPSAVNRPSNADDWTIYQVSSLQKELANGVQTAFDTNGNTQSMRTWTFDGNTNALEWKDWQALATTDDVNTATKNAAYLDQPANFTDGLQSGGVNVATAADLKSVEDSAWRPIISNNYSGLCMMKYNADTETMSLSGTIFPKTYSIEGSRVAVIIPMPEGFSMGENTDSKTTIWTNVNTIVQKFAGVVVDLKYESDGIHIIFDKIYSQYPDPKMFIILDDFFAYSTANPQSNNLINFKVTKN